ncbi:MAG: Hachiman antiphage defense system protein HamA [Lachnospiraceae bacterium]|nr:Hachiman antiphage defense system protein HamA [Lachnospiraceae bacterium]
MDKTYKEIYNELIGEKFRAAIISYKPHRGTYEYLGYSHQAEVNALNDIADLIIDDMVFYAFSENEILRLNDDVDLLVDLRAAAKYAYMERLPKREKAKSDGTMGEVLLDIFIQLASQNTQKLIARAKHTEINSKKEITGYDALYFTKDTTGISLWLGQAKAGQKGYCKSSIIKDLKEKYTKEYFADTAFYIADKNEAPELGELLNEINRICLRVQLNKWNKEEKVKKLFQVLQDKQVRIKIPCLIAYSQKIYSDKTKLETYIETEIREMVDEVDVLKFPIEIGLDYDIVFYIMPIEDVDYIRDKIIDLKKEAI